MSIPSLTLALALVPAARLFVGRVNIQRHLRTYKILIDEAGTNPGLVTPLLGELRQMFARLPELLSSGVSPVIGVHLERDMPAGQLVAVDPSPYLISVYLADGTTTPPVADELGGALGYILRHI